MGQRPRWPNSELPFRSLLPYDAQTLWLLILACFDLILAKLVNQGVASALFSSRRPKNFENEKIFLCLKIAEIDMGVNFGSKRTNIDIKIHFFKVKSISRGKYPNFMTCSPLQRLKFCDVISPNLEKLSHSNFASGMLSWLYWLKQSFILIDWC